MDAREIRENFRWRSGRDVMGLQLEAGESRCHTIGRAFDRRTSHSRLLAHPRWDCFQRFVGAAGLLASQ